MWRRLNLEVGGVWPGILNYVVFYPARSPSSARTRRPAKPEAQPGRERLQPLVIGSTEGVRATIHTLHVLSYAEQATWSQLITIPPSGILITPEQGEVFQYNFQNF